MERLQVKTEDLITSLIEIEEHSVKIEAEEDSLDSQNAAMEQELMEPFEEVFIPENDIKLETEEHQKDCLHQHQSSDGTTSRNSPVDQLGLGRILKVPCEECGIRYFDHEMTDWHSKYCHGTNAFIKVEQIQNVGTNYHCTLCGIVCAYIYDVIRHVRDQHKFNDLPFRCYICGDKSFIYKSGLQRHQRVCKKSVRRCNKNHRCERCDATFVYVEVLDWHNENLHGTHPTMKFIKHGKKRVFQCVFCKDVFKETLPAISHLQRDHQHVKLPFYCNVCNKHFMRKYLLTIHNCIKTYGNSKNVHRQS